MKIEENINAPLMVSIQCTVYNHERYLRKCLDGFVMQRTNFRFEAIVHDDVSTDGSVEIIKEYASKYPDIIKPIYETENQYSKNNGSLTRIMEAASVGKYIACCEGDDCWTDPLKLQTQVDFLERHPDYSYTCHRYIVNNTFDNTERLARNVYFDKHPEETVFSFDRSYVYLTDWVAKTLTSVYRRDAVDYAFLSKLKRKRDVNYMYTILTSGKGACFSFVGGVYNKNVGGIFGSLDSITQDKVDYDVYKEMYQVTRDPVMRECCLVRFRRLVKNKQLSIFKGSFEFNMFVYWVYDGMKRRLHLLQG